MDVRIPHWGINVHHVSYIFSSAASFFYHAAVSKKNILNNKTADYVIYGKAIAAAAEC